MWMTTRQNQLTDPSPRMDDWKAISSSDYRKLCPAKCQCNPRLLQTCLHETTVELQLQALQQERGRMQRQSQRALPFFELPALPAHQPIRRTHLRLQLRTARPKSAFSSSMSKRKILTRSFIARRDLTTSS